jgi:hemerythrin-like domain-containing protein
MELHTHLDYLRAEHKEMLSMVIDLEAAFSLAQGKDIRTRSSGVARLRSHASELPGIVEHCHSVDRLMESPFRSYLDPEEVNALNEDHGRLERHVSDFQRELEFASVDRTSDVITSGNGLIEAIRAHISLEEKILLRIEETNEPSGETLARYIQ